MLRNRWTKMFGWVLVSLSTVFLLLLNSWISGFTTYFFALTNNRFIYNIMTVFVHLHLYLSEDLPAAPQRLIILTLVGVFGIFLIGGSKTNSRKDGRVFSWELAIFYWVFPSIVFLIIGILGKNFGFSMLLLLAVGLISVVFPIIGAYLWVSEKGRSRWFCLFGGFGIFGWIPLALLKNNRL